MGEYKVDVQLNSDNDFDYTIYKNRKHSDGGVLENEKGLETIPDSVLKGIGVQSEDFDWGLVGGNTLNLADLQYVPQVAANLQVQEAIKTIYQNMPELTVVGKEEYLKNAEVQLEDDYGMIDGIINNGPKEEKQIEKPSIIAEIKAAQKEAAEKKREPKEKHHNKCHGHEL